MTKPKKRVQTRKVSRPSEDSLVSSIKSFSLGILNEVGISLRYDDLQLHISLLQLS